MISLELGIGSRVKHKDYKLGVVVQVWADVYDITFIEFGMQQLRKDDPDLDLIDLVSDPEDRVSYSAMESALRQIILDYSDFHPLTEIGRKWIGGTLVLQPHDRSLQSKEILIETFFHKIVMVRDRLRLMEQRINASALSTEDKVNLQQYITRIYGSLTTFNVLFDEKADYFVGEKIH
ncbi:MAG: hypothetical protein PHU97_03525 [Bacteroidales bacterium]|nr:hypothetical protein [Bacteroidales bacterium]MDD2324167.1 hypothetical protein [Bacteroidales bacterium]MDD3010371.1 hypothetical protein [Bacteroidales bacterium]MDD3962013.1 hypothetical protein [Bacteroidales bacterium]MDY0285082.1 hypothetical protein [Bacteroidales bacterium]